MPLSGSSQSYIHMCPQCMDKSRNIIKVTEFDIWKNLCYRCRELRMEDLPNVTQHGSDQCRMRTQGPRSTQGGSQYT